MSTLKVSSRLTPYPYAATAIAEYTEKVQLAFEETNEVTLDLNGSVITTEEQIVQEIAKAGGLSDDSVKAS
jgi:glutamyl-tRNA synthetase